MPDKQRTPDRDNRPVSHREIGARRKLGVALLIVLVSALGASLYIFGPDGGMNIRALQAAPSADHAPSPPAGIEVPEGMAYIPGDRTKIGSEEGNPDEQPVFAARVEPFLMDKHPVTVAEFRAFVEATDYGTEAERFGNAGVFDTRARRWSMVDGATWHHPFGPDQPAAPDDHPVTQVSWNDAVAYARWAGKRLPSEIEWEHAARGGHNARSRYAWGDHLVENGHAHANTWNGIFPLYDKGTDGYRGTSPVGAFGETELGLTDMGGNVWEWTADWYRSYDQRGQPFTPTTGSEKAQRGGSYLCSPNYCHGYRVSARSHSTPESSLAHVGFRTVKDLPER